MRWYRGCQNSAFEYRMLRLQRYGRFEAIVCLLAKRVCGTPVYWYPKRERERIRLSREA